MRIRKNAKHSPLLFSQGFSPRLHQTYICQLNQSPWDVIPFTPSHSVPSPYQFDGDDSVTGNGSFVDSVGAVESIASMMNTGDGGGGDGSRGDGGERGKEVEFMNIDNGEIQLGETEVVMICNKSDGKGWHCRKTVKHGHVMCDHHLHQIRSYNHTHTNKKSSDLAAAVEPRRSRVRCAKKESSSSNPYEFYYYSGFGPSWGKKRGENAKSIENESSESSQKEYNNINIDDDEDDENVDSGKKRRRKPVKNRSLKSLM